MTDQTRTDTSSGAAGAYPDSSGLGSAGSVTFKNPSAISAPAPETRPGLPVLALLLIAVLLLVFAWSEGRDDGRSNPSAGEVVQTQ